MPDNPLKSLAGYSRYISETINRSSLKKNQLRLNLNFLSNLALQHLFRGECVNARIDPTCDFLGPYSPKVLTFSEYAAQ
jgi:hypothetical protein